LSKLIYGDLVSVVIPAYNHQQYIEDALNSVYEQSYQNIELIVLDDFSKDKTLEVTQKWANKKEAEKSSNTTNYQFWRHDNKPIELWSNEVIQQKIDYIHNNPVEEGIVFRPEDYKYSSASDYAGEKGLIDKVIVFQYFKL